MSFACGHRVQSRRTVSQFPAPVEVALHRAVIGSSGPMAFAPAAERRLQLTFQPFRLGFLARRGRSVLLPLARDTFSPPFCSFLAGYAP